MEKEIKPQNKLTLEHCKNLVKELQFKKVSDDTKLKIKESWHHRLIN